MNTVKNKLSKLLLALLVFTTVFVKQSCKKADSFSTENNSKEAIEQKFFNGTQTADEVAKRIAAKFKEFKAKDENYIVSFVEKYGYPRWDKIQVSNSNTNNRSTTEEASIAIIPVVEEEATNVKTCIKSELTPAVTTIDIYELGYYQNLPFGNNTSKINTAEKWVLEFMQQTKIVFGVNSFRIIDKRLFYNQAVYNEPVNRSTYIKFTPNSSDPTGRYPCVTTTWYDIDTHCTNTGGECNTATGECDGCALCITVIEHTDTDCGNGGGGGTGGSGSGGGYGGGSGFTGGGSGGSSGGSGGTGTGTGIVTLPWVLEEDNYDMFDELGNPLDDTYRLQCSIIRQWKNRIANEIPKRKGNFGEIASDTVLQKKGYVKYHNRIANIDAGTHFGIDGLYKKGNTYYIVEAKFSLTGSIVNVDAGPPQQMSTAWLNGPQPGLPSPPPGTSPITRIQFTAGNNSLASTIMASNPIRLLANIKPDGTVTYYQLTVNSDGTVVNVTTTNAVIFNP